MEVFAGGLPGLLNSLQVSTNTDHNRVATYPTKIGAGRVLARIPIPV